MRPVIVCMRAAYWSLRATHWYPQPIHPCDRRTRPCRHGRTGGPRELA
jgi:hypothetical protein